MSHADTDAGLDAVARRCLVCQTPKPEKGRAMDGRRAYRCACCGNVWTEGMQGREKQYSEQRPGYQFRDTGAASPNESSSPTRPT